ncbi:cytochrome c oxidase assembly protein [Ciceribacter sp. L1K22]|uniref:cytochrome c oxidase assembly protein n=1 Tax=Ciceribacter sp. L1K22 TaxID=2820275 RepID=UPI001ABE40B1|nr:cytochrome c oxidase assembly protein [Ciceribacter sp. L1K22]MBO3759156.1 cytochrome c oxidase assembly protein [Ciceribacter sp. L1K22]
MTDAPANTAKQKRSNTTVMLCCVAFVGGMVGMSYAAVPLYRLFCQVTGYNGTTQRVEQASGVILDKTIKVTFDANVSNGLNWEFKPVQRSIEPRIGETVEVMYTATNKSSEPVTGQAIFNVTPMEAAAYFNKIQCFCFTETTLQPGETMEMPVLFFVDPDIASTPETRSIGTITLSYTFYPHETEKPVAALPVDQAGDTGKL